MIKYAPLQAFVFTNGVPLDGSINSYLPPQNNNITVTFALLQ